RHEHEQVLHPLVWAKRAQHADRGRSVHESSATGGARFYREPSDRASAQRSPTMSGELLVICALPYPELPCTCARTVSITAALLAPPRSTCQAGLMHSDRRITTSLLSRFGSFVWPSGVSSSSSRMLTQKSASPSPSA